MSKNMPSSDQLKKELDRAKKKKDKKGSKSFFASLVIAIIVVTAVVSVVTTRFFPIMKIEGNSMMPTLKNGNIAVAIRMNTLERGDICCFYSGSTVLCKRVIAVGGEIINIDANGVVYVDNRALNEPYVNDIDFGNADIVFPYLVPEHAYFVMGDNREVSKDSRYSEIGCVFEGQVIGKLVFNIWPVDDIGSIE